MLSGTVNCSRTASMPPITLSSARLSRYMTPLTIMIVFQGSLRRKESRLLGGGVFGGAGAGDGPVCVGGGAIG